MSEVPPADSEPDVTAAELALGLLDGEERAQALRRMLSDRAFAADVENWRARFGQLFETWPEMEPPARVQEHLERALDPDSGPEPARASRVWPAAAAVSSLIAASLLLFIVIRPPAPVPAPAPAAHGAVMLAAMAPAGKGAPVPAVFDPASDRLSIGRASFAQPGHSAQLWVIGKDGVPHSLGLMAAHAATVITLDPAVRKHMTRGAVIAVSIEPPGGSPTGLPTGPVVAKGPLLSA